MTGLFTLHTPRDLREKLRRELGRLRAEPLNVDFAFNFFVTAEHMLEWVYPKRANKKRREDVRDSEPLLQVCSHLANGGKHFEVEATHHKSVSSTGTGYSFFPPDFFPPGMFPPCYFGGGRLVVRLEQDAARELGSPTFEAVELAEKVMAWWDRHPLK